MEQSMPKEESYADRRQLFKNIWETALSAPRKKGNVGTKSKVVKTLNLENRSVEAKKKKQRVKKLKIICNKLLDFCDRQDGNDTIYGQVASQIRRFQKKRNIKKAKKSKRPFLPSPYQKRRGAASQEESLEINQVYPPEDLKRTPLSIHENYCKKRGKPSRVVNYVGAKFLYIPTARKYSDKKLFPINKVTIT